MDIKELEKLVKSMTKLLPELETLLSAAKQPSAIEALKARGIPLKPDITEEVARTILDSLQPDAQPTEPDVQPNAQPTEPNVQPNAQPTEPNVQPNVQPSEPNVQPNAQPEVVVQAKPSVATKPVAHTGDTARLLAQLTAARNGK